MSAAHTRPRARAKARPAATHAPAPARSRASHAQRSAGLGPHYAAGPVGGLALPAQTKLAVGQPGDAYEQQANAVANHVTSGSQLAPPSISPVTAGALARETATGPEKKKPEPTPAQKAAKPEEKKPAQTPVQKAGIPEPEKKEPEQKLTQRETAKTPAPEEKRPEAAVQKEETNTPPEKNPDPRAIQRAETTTPEDRELESEPVQTAPEQKAGTATPTNAAGQPGSTTPAADRAIGQAGAGRPMNDSTRQTLESRMNADLGDVRVHDDAESQQAARELNARAFTHGRDIWLGSGESDRDLGLMAHEATHVVQQDAGAGVQRQMIQRQPATQTASAEPATATLDAPTALPDKRVQRAMATASAAGTGAAPPPAVGTGTSSPNTPVVQRDGIKPAPGGGTSAPGGPWDFEGPAGKLKVGSKMVIPMMKVPTFKTKVTKTPFVLKASGEEREDTQRATWEKEARGGTGIDSKLTKKVKDENAPALTKSGQPIYFLQLKGKPIYIIGNQTTIKNRSLRPYWDKTGRPLSFQVDHKHELQLGGGEGIDNLWLLEADANMSSGRNIRSEKNERVQKLIDAATKKGVAKVPDLETARKSYEITVETVKGGLAVDGQPDKHWEIKDIRDTALQFDELRVLNKKQIDDKGLQGSPSRLAIFTNEAGGGVRFSDGWAEGDKEKDVKFDFGKLLRVHKVSYDRSGKAGSLHGTAFKNNKIIEEAPFDFPLQESAAVDYGGFVPSGGVTREISSKLKAKGLSPIEIQVAELTDRGLVARGQILPTISVLRNLKINLIIDGDDIYLSRVFSAGDFKFPGPIQVTSASLEVFAGTPGIGARGDVFFEIRKLGKGKLSGKASTSGGFSVAGEFEFDTKLFDPAMVRVEYSNGKFSGSGEIGVPPGKLRGIRSANIKAAFEDERITATGSVKPDIPGIEQGDLSMSYDPVGGLMIAGSLQLKKDIPGIAGGTVTAQVIKKPDAENYIVKASGQATTNIPGISASLSVSYDDGQFDVFGTVGYEKGMLKGSVSVGATNRPIGDDGKPVPGPVDKASKIILYGGGSVTIRLAPWLQATAAIKLLPNGEIEVTGSIGLPQALDLFPEKKLDRNIFKVGIDIPIVGLSVAGQRVGIFASISGGADLSAGIGPGQLRELGLSITYNPSRESETHVTGGAKLHIPAHAGLRLFVRGGLGVGIPLVSAEAGIEIGGAIGLEGALDAGVQVDWTPANGLKLDAFGEISVEPKLRFDITGFVLVEFDYLIDTATLYEKRWQLAAFEYGSGLKFGVKFPVHYEEGKAFDISLSDVQFQTPDINPKELLGDLIKQIA